MDNALKIEITNIANGGFGIGKNNGKVIFVPFAYPGDVVEVAISSDKKNYSWGSIKNIIISSEHRLSPLCPYMGICGGCMWGTAKYESQLIWKKHLVQNAFKNTIKLEKEVIVVSNKDLIYNYRTRVKFHSNGKTVGFYKFHSNEVVDVSKCIIIHKNFIEILNNFINIPKNTEILITTHPYEKLFMIYTLRRIKSIENKFKDIYNYKNNSIQRNFFLVNGVPIVNGSFSQNSFILNHLLKNTVTNSLNLSKGKILDLYCGSGNLTINLPSSKFEVVGIDIDPFAIEYAKKYSPYDYRVGDELTMKEVISSAKWDAIILDPPREGAKNLMNILKNANTSKIIYVSCNYITQCRDIKYLIEGGWKVDNISIVDLFPHTPHIETVVLLTK